MYFEELLRLTLVAAFINDPVCGIEHVRSRTDRPNHKLCLVRPEIAKQLKGLSAIHMCLDANISKAHR